MYLFVAFDFLLIIHSSLLFISIEIRSIFPSPLVIFSHALTISDPLSCSRTSTDPCYAAFHDEEWGVPVHDDKYVPQPQYLSFLEPYKLP